MSHRRIITIAGITTIILMVIIAALIRNDTIRMLTVLGTLTIISLITIGVGAAFGKTKMTYQIAGPVIAWFVAHQVWYLWSPETFRTATDAASFWAFEIAFLVIFLALLGRIKIAVVFIRTATALLLLVSFGSLVANFIEGGPELMSEAKNNIRRTTAQGQIIEIKNLDKQRRADPLLARLKELKSKSKEKLLSRSEHLELRKIKQELEKIYPKLSKPETTKLSANRRLSSSSPTTILVIPAGDGFYRPGIFLKEGDHITIRSLSDELALLRNADTDSVMIISRKGLIRRRCETAGELAFKRRSRSTKVAYIISPG